MSDENSYELMMPFVVCQSYGGIYQDHGFVAGCEFGYINGLLEAEPPTLERYVRTETMAQYDLLAMHKGYSIHAEPWDEDTEWTYALFTKEAKPMTAMTDDLSGLEGWVEVVRAILEEVGLGYGANGMDYEIEAPAIVLALAEPLRRGEQLQLDIVGMNEMLDEWKAAVWRKDRRIERLEAVVAAARDLVTARYDAGADYSGAVIRLRKAIKSLDTEAKP